MTSGEQKCARCGAAGACHTAVVPVPSIYQAKDPCPHGPFCARCGNRKEELTLPQCECRALICSWNPPLPPPGRRPRPREAKASTPAADDALLLPKGRAPLREAPMARAPQREAPVEKADPARAEEIRRALAAVDSMIASGRDDSEEPPEDEGTTLPRVEATPLPSPRTLSPRRSAGEDPRRRPPQMQETAGSVSLAESLQLRGGRPLADKAQSSGSVLSYFSDAIMQLYEAYESFENSLGCVNPTFADSEECRQSPRRANVGRGGG